MLWRAAGYWALIVMGKRVLTVAVLMLWILLGPIAMAFDGCLLMGTLCDSGPCASSSSTAFVPAPLIGLEPIGFLAAGRRLVLPANSPATLEPPPKSPLLAA
jgi:hypothetical protein